MMSTNISQQLSGMFSDGSLKLIVSTCLLPVFVYFLSFLFQQSSEFPFINYDKSQWTYKQAQLSFNSRAKMLIREGFKKFCGPFNVVTDSGPMVMLPPEFIEAVNQEPKLDFDLFIGREFLSNYDTFRTFGGNPEGMFNEAVMKGLTRNLPRFTKQLSDEMTLCLNDTWGQSPEWHEVYLRGNVLDWVSRLSSRIFNGDRLTQNKEWLRICKEFTVEVFQAVRMVKAYPAPLRWFAERTLPICRQVRSDRAILTSILAPILAERKSEIATAKQENREPTLPNDSIEWFRNASRGRQYNDTTIQISLQVAAIHTTSDLIGQAILNLGTHPEMVEPLRDEAIAVLKEYGWQKVALTELRILDSFLKETQRLKPIGMASMRRIATEDVEIHGVKIHKGERTAISSHRMWSESDYENPEKFDGFRFVKRRKIPGFEHISHLIATSEDHTAFSHGKHACPGRFFAANEVKIAMVHVLLKYDVELDDPSAANWIEIGASMLANPRAKARVRRRKEEIDLDSLVADK